MLLNYVFIAFNFNILTDAYQNNLFHIGDTNMNFSVADCGDFNMPPSGLEVNISTSNTVSHSLHLEEDPLHAFTGAINKILFNDKNTFDASTPDAGVSPVDIDLLAHFPSGAVMRAETFQTKKGVHLPHASWLHRGHCYLNLTKDYMQTAVDAFAILLYGNMDDVLRLPPLYVLKSARTISMMKISREKLGAMWTVIKREHDPVEISYQTLELFRPLFKYVNGKEISKLNLDDSRILSYIGTHADLDRHQVGVVASRYIQLNPNWRMPRYLNLMNNLLCGVPMNFMRRVPENTYLQLSHQLFYHIRACDPLQRRFYLAMMTRTQVLGKSNSWGARDVARLGLLLTEVDGPELSAINPEAMVGVTAQVMTEMSAANLMHFTKMQLSYLSQPSLNILTRKLNSLESQLKIMNSATALKKHLYTLALSLIYVMCPRF